MQEVTSRQDVQVQEVTSWRACVSACNCNPSGTIIQPGVIGCDPQTGQCPCLPSVGGRQCERCDPGYWNLESGNGQCSPPAVQPHLFNAALSLLASE